MPEWGDQWRDHFGVDVINGESGHELKYHGRSLVASYLKVGLIEPQAWRTFKLRQDFIASEKMQAEDDITASVVVPADRLQHLAAGSEAESYKFVANCEYRFFQRPDDAIHRGLDKQAEFDLSQPGNFISNFEPLTLKQVSEMAKYVVDFDAFSQPMQDLSDRYAAAARRLCGLLGEPATSGWQADSQSTLLTSPTRLGASYRWLRSRDGDTTLSGRT